MNIIFESFVIFILLFVKNFPAICIYVNVDKNVLL